LPLTSKFIAKVNSISRFPSIGADFGGSARARAPTIEKRPCIHQLLPPFYPNILYKSTPVFPSYSANN